ALSAQQGAAPGAPPQGGPSFPRVPPLPFPEAPQTFQTLAHSIRVVPFVRGLANPWSLTFLPNGDILVTEKPGRLRIVRKGTLDPAVGERTDRKRAQDTTQHGGKILRLRDDGTVPPDNPFVGRAGIRPEIYTYGHRNLQGLTFHPVTGALWETEHGPQGGDEL